MKRFLCTFLCFLLLFSSLGIRANAEESGSEVLSAYLTEDTLHAFFPAAQSDLSVMKASTEEYRGYNAQPELYYRAGKTSYVVLLDSTLSMGKRRNQVAEFFQELSDDSLLKPRIIVIPFNTDIVKDAILDSESFEKTDDFLDAVKEIQYSDSNTAIYTSALSAADWIDARFPVEEKGLVNLILICDELENRENRQQAEERYSHSPEILFHAAVAKTDWVKGFEGKGICEELSPKNNLRSTAQQIKEQLRTLARVDLRIEKIDPVEQRQSIEFYLRTGAGTTGADTSYDYHKQIAENVPVLNKDAESGRIYLRGIEISPEEEQNNDPAEGTKDAATPATEGDADPEASPTAEEGRDQETNPSAETGPGTTEPGGEENPEGEGDTAGTEDPISGDEPETGSDAEEVGGESEDDLSKTGAHRKLWLYIGIAGLVLLAAIVFFSIRAGRNRARGNGLNMQLEILSGNCKTRRRSFALSDELLIGRDRGCDICFTDPEVSGKNSRIFFQENLIMIEDLDSTNGTTVQGIRIFSPNRLRSGDVIGIGRVQFLLRF